MFDLMNFGKVFILLSSIIKNQFSNAQMLYYILRKQLLHLIVPALDKNTQI